MSTRYWKLLLITSFAVLLCLAVIAGLGTTPANAGQSHSSAAGPICTVDAGGGGDYTSIPAAVADTGCTTINVATGVYSDFVSIGRSLALHGAGSGSTFIEGDGYTAVYLHGASTVVTITDLTVQHGNRRRDRTFRADRGFHRHRSLHVGRIGESVRDQRRFERHDRLPGPDRRADFAGENERCIHVSMSFCV